MIEIKPHLTVNKVNYNLLIFGMKGYGKTSLVRGLIQNEKRIIILDTLKYEYDESDGKVLEDYHALLIELQQVFTRSDSADFKIVLRSPKEANHLFRLFLEMRFVTLVVEEIDNYCTLYDIDPALLEHMKYGRHRECNLIGVSRHPQEVHPELRKGSDVIISFRQDEPNVLKYLSQVNGELVKELPALQRGEYRVLKGENYLNEFLQRNIT